MPALRAPCLGEGSWLLFEFLIVHFITRVLPAVMRSPNPLLVALFTAWHHVEHQQE